MGNEVFRDVSKQMATFLMKICYGHSENNRNANSLYRNDKRKNMVITNIIGFLAMSKSIIQIIEENHNLWMKDFP